jgi:hypothetical protein
MGSPQLSMSVRVWILKKDCLWAKCCKESELMKHLNRPGADA